MTLKQIAALGRKLVSFLTLFDDCFRRRKGADLLRTYVKGQPSDIHRNTAEAIALSARRPPRTLHRSLPASYTHLRSPETLEDRVCRLPLELQIPHTM